MAKTFTREDTIAGCTCITIGSIFTFILLLVGVVMMSVFSVESPTNKTMIRAI